MTSMPTQPPTIRRARRQFTPRECTAYHEAGHALIGHLHFGNEGPIWVDEEGNGQAITLRATWTAPKIAAALQKTKAGSERSRMLVGTAEKGMRHALAGKAAASILTGRRPSMKSWDFIEAVAFHISSIRGGLRPSESATDSAIAAQYQLVRRYLRQNWEHVDAVAQALLASSGALHQELWLEAMLTKGPLPQPSWEVLGSW